MGAESPGATPPRGSATHTIRARGPWSHARDPEATAGRHQGIRKSALNAAILALVAGLVGWLIGLLIGLRSETEVNIYRAGLFWGLIGALIGGLVPGIACIQHFEGFNQVVISISRVLLYFPLSTGLPTSGREYSDAGMSPVPE